VSLLNIGAARTRPRCFQVVGRQLIKTKYLFFPAGLALNLHFSSCFQEEDDEYEKTYKKETKRKIDVIRVNEEKKVCKTMRNEKDKLKRQEKEEE
jgi:hypothetical protein